MWCAWYLTEQGEDHTCTEADLQWARRVERTLCAILRRREVEAAMEVFQ